MYNTIIYANILVTNNVSDTAETVIEIIVSELIEEPGNGNCDITTLVSQLSE